MPRIYLFLSLTVFFTCIVACKSTRYKPDNLPAQQLRWGKGGGFTGVETTFVVLENGQVFKKDNLQATWTEQAKIKKKKVKKVFEQAMKIRLDQGLKTASDNMYAFVELPDGKGAMMRFTYSPTKAAADPEIMGLYHALSALLEQ
jgi:hypothetical protein